MEPDIDRVTIETRGRLCFLCRKIFSCSESEEGLRSSGGHGHSSLKLLMRYVNTSELSSSPLNQTGKNHFLENNELTRSLCEECSDVMDRFSKSYEEFEAIRLQLDSCVQSVFNLIKTGDELRGGIIDLNLKEEDKTTFDECLRSELMLKCSQKLTSLPRVQIRKESLPPVPAPPSFLAVSLNEQDNPIQNLTKASLQFETNHTEVKPEVNDDLEDNEFFEIEDEDLTRFELSVEDFNADRDPLGSDAATSSTLHQNWFNSFTYVPQDIETNCKTNIVKCTFCDKSFLRNSQPPIERHLASTHALQIYAADLPPGTSRHDLDTAIKEVFKGRRKCKSEKNPIGCPKCIKNFKQFYDFKLHLIYAHFDAILEKLKATSHSSKNGVGFEKSYKNSQVKCVFCRKYFTKHDYHTHASSVHTMEFYSNLLPPEVSRAQVDEAVQQVISMKRNSGIPYKPVGCPNCQRNFPSCSYLKQHIYLKHFDIVVGNLQLGCLADAEDRNAHRNGNLEMGMKTEEGEVKLEIPIEIMY